MGQGMHAILIFFMVILLIIEAVGGILSLISLPTLCGYFLIRAVLKMLGLHSGSPEQVRNELKFTAICGVIVLVTVTSGLVGAFVAPD
jgi:1,4-dihydroxy-2-naphthoate octaprenyltransferase